MGMDNDILDSSSTTYFDVTMWQCAAVGCPKAIASTAAVSVENIFFQGGMAGENSNQKILRSVGPGWVK